MAAADSKRREPAVAHGEFGHVIFPAKRGGTRAISIHSAEVADAIREALKRQECSDSPSIDGFPIDTGKYRE